MSYLRKDNKLDFLYRVIYFIELNWLIIDSIGGYFLNRSNGQSPINSMVRGLLLCLIAFIFLVDNSIRGRILPFLLLILFSFINFLQLLVLEYDTINIGILFKLLMLPVFILLVRHQIVSGKISQKQIVNIVIINSLILFLNIALSYLGIGFSNYGVNQDGEFVGGTGFFYAGNEVGGVILVLCCLALYFASQRGIRQIILVSTLFVICALGLLSKTALASVLLNLALFFFLFSGRKTTLAALILIPSAFLIFQENILYQIDLFWNRLSYFAAMHGWDTMLMGGYKRQQAIADFFEVLDKKTIIFFIGRGWNGEMENNFFDVFESYGVLGYLFFLIPIGLSIQPLKRIKVKIKSRDFAILFNLMLIFFVSIIAGHILQSAMLSLFLAILINMGWLKNLSRPV